MTAFVKGVKSMRHKLSIKLILAVPILAIAALACQPAELIPSGNWGGVVLDGGFAYSVNADGRILRFYADDSLGEEAGRLDNDWMYPASSQVGIGQSYGTPIVSEGILYAAGYSCEAVARDCTSRIVAIDLSEEVARPVVAPVSLPTRIVGALGIHESLLVGATSQQINEEGADGVLVGWDKNNLRELWRVDLDGEVWGDITVDSGVGYVGTTAGSIYAFDLTTPSASPPPILWQYNLDAAIVTKPLIQDGFLYVGTLGNEGFVHALNLSVRTNDPQGVGEVGAGEWSFATGAWVWSNPVIIDDAIYAGTFEGDLHGIDVRSGERIPDLSEPITLDSPIIGDLVAVGTGDGTRIAVPIYEPFLESNNGVAIFSTNGVLQSMLSTDFGVAAPPVGSDSIIFIQNLGGSTLAIDYTTGVRLGCGRFVTDGGLSTLAVCN